MVISETRGRLGNIMFCIACGYSYAQKKNTDFFTKQDGNEDYYNRIHDFLFKNIKSIDNKNISHISFSIDEMSPIGFDNIPVLDGNVILKGYRQSPFYFTEDEANEIFHFSDDAVNEANRLYNIKLDEFIAIHVRRGDYLKHENQPLFYVRDTNYYNSFIDKFDKSQKFLFFSDDIDWCKNNFSSNDNCYFADKKSDTVPEEIIDLYLMTKCKSVLISNSTFSWWGAYLNKNKDKKIYYTLPWMKVNFKCNIIPNDERWIELK